jgi:ABC-type methionine transport system permease subunit
MSVRAIPLLVIAFILYNAIALSVGVGGLGNAVLPTIKMLSGGEWTFTWGDLILLVTLVLLFIEILKSTFTSTSSLIDHALSMVVFIAVLVEFLMVKEAATSTFFMILVACLIDVIAGYTIGIRVARRDLSIGADQ